ncbi:MAG: flagellar basal body P-ring formation protein FlgA [Proteobacteria bacterium]|nr:flagellar basal body P-ring formation protein FlgA [Pseudomonadota bacterium]
MKILLILLVLALSVPAPPVAAAPAAEAAPVTLRQSVTVSGKLVRLGDLFVPAGDKAEAAVAYAPAPGKRAVFDARWLYRVARAYGLNWRPLSVHERAVVARESIVIGRREIADRILAALVDKGVDADMQVELSNRMLRIHVPGDSTATVAVEDVAYDPRTRRFIAIVAAPADDPAARRIRVTGRVHRVIDVPVLTRRVLAGEVIRERDVKRISMRSDRLHRDTIQDPGALIGKSPRRGLRAGVPVRVSDVRLPVLVPRRSLVTITYRVRSMTLTAQGRALEDGGAGDTVRVANTQSNTVVQAVVTGTNRVSVHPAGPIAMK